MTMCMDTDKKAQEKEQTAERADMPDTTAPAGADPAAAEFAANPAAAASPAPAPDDTATTGAHAAMSAGQVPLTGPDRPPQDRTASPRATSPEIAASVQSAEEQANHHTTDPAGTDAAAHPAGADPAAAEFATNPASTEPAPAVAYAADAPEEPTAAQAASEPVGRRAARKAAEREAAGLDEEKPATKGQAVLGVMRDVLIAAAIAGCVLFFFKPILVQQRSMEPTFSNGDYIIVSRQAYTLLGDPQHGDVVIFRSRLKDEHNRDKNLIKRLIALPGDTIEIRDGYVYLNGEQQEELYTKDPGETWASGPDGSMPPLTIPEGKVFAMGDNRLNSQDSRDATVGLVDIDDIVGKVVLRLFPFNQIKTF